MFDFNEFKRSVKSWMRDNPQGSTMDLVEFCEEVIPPAQYQSNQWVIEQTVSWYKHVLSHRERAAQPVEADDID
jgi:hypothetical protein